MVDLQFAVSRREFAFLAEQACEARMKRIGAELLGMIEKKKKKKKKKSHIQRGSGGGGSGGSSGTP